MAKRGRPLKINADQQALLVDIVESNPTATLREIQQELAVGGELEVNAQVNNRSELFASPGYADNLFDKDYVLQSPRGRDDTLNVGDPRTSGVIGQLWF